MPEFPGNRKCEEHARWTPAVSAGPTISGPKDEDYWKKVSWHSPRPSHDLGVPERKCGAIEFRPVLQQIRFSKPPGFARPPSAGGRFKANCLGTPETPEELGLRFEPVRGSGPPLQGRRAVPGFWPAFFSLCFSPFFRGEKRWSFAALVVNGSCSFTSRWTSAPRKLAHAGPGLHGSGSPGECCFLKDHLAALGPEFFWGCGQPSRFTLRAMPVGTETTILAGKCRGKKCRA